MAYTTVNRRKRAHNKTVSWLGLFFLASPFVSFAGLGLSLAFLVQTLHSPETPVPLEAPPPPVVSEVATAHRSSETLPSVELPVWSNQLDKGFASRIVKYILRQGYQVDTKPGEYNIIYIEGMDPDGSLNDDLPNKFNDLRLLIEFVEGKPVIIGRWEATTEPGMHHTSVKVLNSKGAARIQFGQYTAWKMGWHGENPHPALQQVEPVTVHRDLNQDFMRPGDELDTDLFGINQHWGYDYPIDDIRDASAGCLVGRTWEGHQAFMDFLRQDRRYQADSNFVFTTTIIPGDELAKQFPQ